MRLALVLSKDIKLEQNSMEKKLLEEGYEPKS
jgi:hypothetical protein